MCASIESVENLIEAGISIYVTYICQSLCSRLSAWRHSLMLLSDHHIVCARPADSWGCHHPHPSNRAPTPAQLRDIRMNQQEQDGQECAEQVLQMRKEEEERKKKEEEEERSRSLKEHDRIRKDREREMRLKARQDEEARPLCHGVHIAQALP